ncbi:DUF2190 domain-containing protein [Rhodopseudomonas sp. BR0G17]|jgi:hypothetical protein|uniref:DUF2190 domain-containing protein n=1 Tax=Rhodopseudomonas sp. BR0G17 TaxID=2269368 RepID=UPI0013DFCCA7|nr:DUF2190 domain-containing protein [Rhodopseudomonas sp. BR0G17]NEW96924.1 DUF2190 domain-containing protein [Rhodopseudomonas sp. BR0G17]
MSAELIKSFVADAAIRGYRICAFHASKQAAIEGASNTAALIGVSTSTGAKAAGVVDIIQSGLGEVTLGGNVGRGALVTSDDQGRAVVVPAPAVAAKTVRTIGQVQASGVEGDIVPIVLAPGAVYVPASS